MLFCVCKHSYVTKSITSAVYEKCGNATNVNSALHLCSDGAPDKLQAKPPLRIEDELRVRRSLSRLIAAAKDLVEDTLINLDLASEDLLVYRVLTSS